MSSPSKWKLINSWVKRRTSYLLIGMGLFFVLVIIFSPLLMSKQFDQSLVLEPESTKELGPIAVKSNLLGSTRIEVRPNLRKQRWATYEVQLIDQKNQLVMSGVKNAWRETGTWYEDGESGTWDESDKNSGIDLRLRRAEPVKVAISLVEVSDTRGRPLRESLSFRVTAHQGTIETNPLWFAAVSIGILGALRLDK